MTANKAGVDDPAGLLTVGKTAFTAVLFTVTMEICLVSRYWTWLFAFVVVFSVGLWFPILVAVPRVYPYPVSLATFWLAFHPGRPGGMRTAGAWRQFREKQCTTTLIVEHLSIQ